MIPLGDNAGIVPCKKILPLAEGRILGGERRVPLLKRVHERTVFDSAFACVLSLQWELPGRIRELVAR